ncbi:MAG TPA: O-acetyl-ADP-ribose deacetylase [Planctomycetota bacterium]|nr:O-acetyl-ADP-ribose deacetylase [Planctomycetota bacterium]
MTERQVGKTLLRLVQGDITTQKVDAIVNAANPSLMGGGGVDGAIHRVGGPTIKEECKIIVSWKGRLPTGEAVITSAGRLPAKFVVHTVGPVWHGGNANEDALLANAYRNSLSVAAEHKCRSVAFPSISTGAYGFPIARAARIALSTLVAQIPAHDFDEVSIVLFLPDDLRVYSTALDQIA